MIGTNETVAAGCETLPPAGQGSDRQAAHYYRAQHARALQREQAWKEKALAAQKIIAQLLVLVGWFVEQVGDFKRQLAWLKKQQFGSKSEITQNKDPSPWSEESGGRAQAANPEEGSDRSSNGQGVCPSKRRRGQQRGAKGPKRRRRVELPEQVIHHRVDPAQRTCAGCGKLRPELTLTEESEEIGWEVRLVRCRHVRHRYGPSCDCPQGQGIRTAPKPAKLIAKGLFAVSFWVQVLLKKFEFQQPIARTIRELKTQGLDVSPGTIAGGLKKIKELVQPLAGQFVLQSREGAHWHMDETRWPMFCVRAAENRRLWWLWVVVTPEVTAFLLEPTRSGQVPRDFFPKGTAGIVNVDRYKGYFGLLGSDWSLQLAFCWSHQRRDFVNVAQAKDEGQGWAEEWVGLINRLFGINAQRRQAWFKEQKELFQALDQEVRQQVQQIQERLDSELAGGQLGRAPQKILKSMRGHWQGLCVFVDHPWVPMDNNAAERANRSAAVARKNFYGSGSEWSGELACACFTILATLRQHDLCPRKYFQAYLEACARKGGRAPENLEEFLPWKWSVEKKQAWQAEERPP